MRAISKEAAEAVALDAFAYLAAEDELLMRFANVSGILPADMRQAASEPHFLPAVLDFFLSHEPDLMQLSETIAVAPEQIVAARHTLAPEDQAGWE